MILSYDGIKRRLGMNIGEGRFFFFFFGVLLTAVNNYISLILSLFC